MASCLKISTSICGLCLIALVLLQPISADTEDNEVGDDPETHMMQGVKVYSNERQCALVGGLCVHSSDCLQPTTNRGLCPNNSHLGIECCYELPMRPAPCREHSGDCMDWCHVNLRRPGTDCPTNKFCCVLV